MEEEVPVRELLPVPQRGLGYGYVCDAIVPLCKLARPYFLQPLIGKYGPWERTATKEWWEDRDEQLRFAQLFSRDLFDDMAYRRLPTHLDEERPWKYYSSKVLNTFLMTHGQTELDMQLGELSDIALPQYVPDRKSSLLVDKVLLSMRLCM